MSMRKERKIINTNIRLNLLDEADRQAWEYLQTMNRKKYKSYTRAVVAAVNDYFGREYEKEEDPYLETREKEDAFLTGAERYQRRGKRIGSYVTCEKSHGAAASVYEWCRKAVCARKRRDCFCC